MIQTAAARRVGFLLYFLLIISLFFIVTAIGCSNNQFRELDVVQRQIRSVLELPSYEHVYHEVIYLGEESSFLGIKTRDKRLLFSLDMHVLAGIDLDKGIKLIPGKKGSLEVTLPPPAVLLIDADEESIHQYFILERGSAVTQTDFYREIEASKASIMEDALQRGILQKARENARDMVRSILQGAGFSDIRFAEARSES